jgi:ribonuclease HI
MAPKKFYAVRKGYTTGIFYSWTECKKQVLGYKGSIFKSFPTLKEAEDFLKGNEISFKIESGVKINPNPKKNSKKILCYKKRIKNWYI